MSEQALPYNTEKVFISDEMDGLQCHHYKEDYSFIDNNSMKFRGIIADGTSILCRSFAYTPEFNSNDENLKEILYPLLAKGPKVFDSYEGSLLRLWYDNREGYNKWRLSTHRRIEAFTSRWGSETSYGEFFIQGLVLKFGSSENPFDDFTSKLNKNLIYVFLLRNGKHNRVVCDTQESIALYSIGVFDKLNNFVFSFEDNETGLPKTEVAPVDITDDLDVSFNNIIEYVNSVNPYDRQGVVIIASGASMDIEALKVVNSEYWRLSKLRGNNPNFIKRYIELRGKEEVNDYISLYNEHKELFDECENVLADITNNILKKYVNRYVRKRAAILPPEQFYIIKEIHKSYLTHKQPITYTDVENIVNGQTPKQLFYIYQQFMNRKEKFGDGNLLPQEDADRLLSQIKSH
jgi:hypothetical protein